MFRLTNDVQTRLKHTMVIMRQSKIQVQKLIIYCTLILLYTQ